MSFMRGPAVRGSALDEALRLVPAEVHSTLLSAGFVPSWDAGNIWFYDKGDLRLVADEDWFDLPQSLSDQVKIWRVAEDSEDVIVAEGPLGHVLAAVA